jgi:hypothetical protein
MDVVYKNKNKKKGGKKREKTVCPREDSAEIHEHSLSVNN